MENKVKPPVAAPEVDEKMQPLVDEKARLEEELKRLREDPTLAADGKLVEVKSDEPLKYSEFRRLNKMLGDLSSDHETIAKVVQLVKKECRKAIDVCP